MNEISLELSIKIEIMINRYLLYLPHYLILFKHTNNLLHIKIKCFYTVRRELQAILNDTCQHQMQQFSPFLDYTWFLSSQYNRYRQFSSSFTTGIVS